MTYNALYEKFVDSGSNEIQGYIAYGLYKSAKRQWVLQFKQENGRSPKPSEVSNYVSAYTSQTISTFETQAAGILAAFADDAIQDARPAIVEEALRGSFWGSVWQSVAANSIYTLILLMFALVLLFAGVDIIGLFEKIRGK